MLLKILFTLLLTSLIYATTNESEVATVLIVKGNVKAITKDGKEFAVKIDQKLMEGTKVETADKSYAKVIFIDKSQMTIAPKSTMEITTFPKKNAGIISLIKGQIRSQVTKDYMQMDDKEKSKLFIKTQTAAMGIRGTDFQVNFNPENQNTTLITFEGKVRLAAIERDQIRANFDQINLEKIVSSEKSVLVKQGEISAVNLNIAERAMIPTTLNPDQLKTLEKAAPVNENSSKADEVQKMQFKSPIPPMVEGTAFSNNNQELEKVAPKEVVIKIKEEKKQDLADKANPDGFVNEKNGAYKLPAGTAIDLNTLNLIPPPANAVFDENTKTYKLPETFGKIDQNSGEYKAPAGTVLKHDGNFERIKDQKSEIINSDNLPKNIKDIRPEINRFSDKFSPVMQEKADLKNRVIDPNLKKIIQEKINTTETIKQNTVGEPGTTIKPRTTTNINLNVR